jgi:GDP-D-mannose 3',5'-epimerase
MRVLVTGAAGFIGANLVASLKAGGHWVRAIDIKTTPHRAFLYELADELRTDCDLRLGDHGALDGVDQVFHLAADHGGAGYFHSVADFKAAMNNLRIDQTVLRAAMGHVERLFFAGSACTYPTGLQGEGARPVRESDFDQGPAEALYGAAKRMSTQLMDGARAHGLDARVGIFHTIYGPGQDYLEPRAKFPTALCRKLIEDPDRVEVWGDGSQVRTFLYIDDALDRIERVMGAEDYRGPVNIGSDEAVSIRDCCDWTAHAAGACPEWVWIDGPTGVPCRAADNSEWDRRYGTTPLISARDGFARTYWWLATHPAGVTSGWLLDGK